MVKLLKSITGHNGAIYDVQVDSKNRIYTTSADKFVARWLFNEGTQDKFAIKLDNSAYRILLLGDDLLVVGLSTGGIHVFDLTTNTELKNIEQHRSAIFALAYNPVNKEFYSADKDGYFCVWDALTFELKITQPLNCGKIREISLNDRGKLIALCCADGNVRILETNFFNEIITIDAHKNGANCALFNGDILYTGGKDAYLRKWNWQSEKLLNAIPAHNYAIYDLLDFEDTIVTASFDKSIKLWKANTLSIIQRIERKDQGHSHTVNRLAKISDNTFVSVGDDKRIQCWEINF